MFTAAAAQRSLPPDALGSGSASSIAPSPRLLCSGPPLSWGGHGLWGGRGITNLFPSSSQTVHLPAEAWGGNCSNKTGWGFAQDRRYWIPLIDTEMLTEGAWAAHTNIQCWSSSAQASEQILNSSRDRNPPPLCVSFPSELLSEHFFHLCITTTLRHSTFVHSDPGHTLHLDLPPAAWNPIHEEWPQLVPASTKPLLVPVLGTSQQHEDGGIQNCPSSVLGSLGVSTAHLTWFLRFRGPMLM